MTILLGAIVYGKEAIFHHTSDEYVPSKQRFMEICKDKVTSVNQL